MEFCSMPSLSEHQKLAPKAEVPCCLGSPQCLCSDCKVEALFGGFTTTDFLIKSEQAKRLGSYPKKSSLGDGHRCKKFPCPVCNPGRSQRGGVSRSIGAEVAVPQVLKAGVTFFGDGGHTCRGFPCPICHKGRSASAAREYGC